MKAVIFDMDGVVVDSEPRHEQAFLEVVKEIGFGERLTLNFADYVGRSDHELWMDFVATHRPPQTLEQLMTMKRRRVLEIIRRDEPIFAGLRELVEQLAAVYSLGLASGSESLVIDAVLALRGLRRFFTAVVSASEVERGKPAPDIFLRTAELLQVAPAECWVVEDSKPGIAAGLAAGMRVIAITNTHPRKDLAHASHVVSSCREIGELLL